VPLNANKKSQDVVVNIDYAKFKYDSTRTLLEIYYFVFINPSTVENENNYNVNIDFEILNNYTDSLLANQTISIPFKIEGNVSSQGKIGQFKLVLPLGDYNMQFSYNKNFSINEKTEKNIIRKKINIDSFEKNELCFSDIELCKNIVDNSQQTESPFYKNTMLVIPNPTNKYGKEIPALYYYIELYNLQHYKNKKLLIESQIINLNGEVVNSKKYFRKYDSFSAAERGVFPVNKLITGNYSLKLLVKDEDFQIIDLKVREFFVSGVNIEVAEKGQSAIKNNSIIFDRFSKYNKEQLDTIFAQSSYIASNNEKKVFNSFFDKKGKLQFLVKFWNKKNRQYGKNLEEIYFNRVDYVNTLYQASFKKGWQTERGRVYILYGPPNEIERPDLSENSKVEIWYYNHIQGGVEFDFVDFSGFGDYNLLNSTHPKEDNNPEWKEYIK
ncbi:MAG: GWxTD domain-containing protein, partial [Calditrichia bacterium]|nr:GWxTD domain-containing protein [Calditrichia bacterium]